VDVLVEAFNLLTYVDCHTRLAELLANFLLKLLHGSMKVSLAQYTRIARVGTKTYQ
jgi:hypothetical protein